MSCNTSNWIYKLALTSTRPETVDKGFNSLAKLSSEK